MGKSSLEELMKKNLLFQNLESDEVAKILALSEKQNYQAGDLVFAQDQEAKKLFVVEKGSVGMILQLKPGTEQMIATELSGGLFGWAALLPPYRYTTSAKCLEPSQLITLDGSKVRALCFQEPRLGVVLMEGLAQFIANRIYWTNTRLIEDIWK